MPNQRLNGMGTKWAVARADFFCGKRMHSTITGLSSRVPTAAIAHSKKMRGMFECCGAGDQTPDPQIFDFGGFLPVTWHGRQKRRHDFCRSLEQQLPKEAHALSARSGSATIDLDGTGA